MSLLILLVLSIHPTHAAISHIQRVGTTDNITVKPYQSEGWVYLIGPLNEPICIFQDSKVISQADKSKIECNKITNGNILITMKDVTKSIAGIYKWAVGSQANMKTKLMTLFVRDTPTTPYITYQKIPILHKPFTLQCHTNSTTIPSGHNLTMVYEWRRNRKVFWGDHKSTLAIHTFRWKKLQRFRCTSTEKGIRSPESQPVKVTAEYPAEVTALTVNTFTPVDEGSFVRLICEIDSMIPTKITWKKNEEVLQKSTLQTMNVTKHTYMDLINIQCSDMGTYRCVAENKLGKNSKEIQVDVNCIPSPTSAYSVETYFIPAEVSEHIDFDITANPEPKVIHFTHTLENGTMSMKGAEVPKHMKHLNGPFYRLTVIYLDTQETDAGDYTVTVDNGLGQYQILYTLVVQVETEHPILPGSLFTAIFSSIVGCSIVILVTCYLFLKGRTMPNGRHQNLHPEVAEMAAFEIPEHIYEDVDPRLSTLSGNSYLHATPTRYISLKRIHDQDSEVCNGPIIVKYKTI